MRCLVSCGSTSFPWLVFFFGALLWGSLIHKHAGRWIWQGSLEWIYCVEYVQNEFKKTHEFSLFFNFLSQDSMYLTIKYLCALKKGAMTTLMYSTYLSIGLIYEKLRAWIFIRFFDEFQKLLQNLLFQLLTLKQNVLRSQIHSLHTYEENDDQPRCDEASTFEYRLESNYCIWFKRTWKQGFDFKYILNWGDHS